MSQSLKKVVTPRQQYTDPDENVGGGGILRKSKTKAFDRKANRDDLAVEEQDSYGGRGALTGQVRSGADSFRGSESALT